MSVATPDVDVEDLTGLDFEVHLRCTHEFHGTDHPSGRWHADGDEVLVTFVCPLCGPEPGMKVRCATFVSHVQAGTVFVRCRRCSHVAPDGRYIVHGPANSRGTHS